MQKSRESIGNPGWAAAYFKFVFLLYRLLFRQKKKNSVDFSEIQVENCSFKEALTDQLALEELHIQLKNEYEEGFNADYRELPVEMKRRIDYTPITVIEIKIDDERQRTKILRKIFENLNAKGSLLTQQELRNGIYACDFYTMLQDYN